MAIDKSNLIWAHKPHHQSSSRTIYFILLIQIVPNQLKEILSLTVHLKMNMKTFKNVRFIQWRQVYHCHKDDALPQAIWVLLAKSYSAWSMGFQFHLGKFLKIWDDEAWEGEGWCPPSKADIFSMGLIPVIGRSVVILGYLQIPSGIWHL